MKTEVQPQALTIVGLELRTSNDVANQTIPAHWERFMTQGTLEKIPNKRSNDIYAVYTNYEHEGLNNNNGTYSMVIGAAVSSLENMPSDFIAVELPASNYEVVSVPQGRPELVGQTWLKIWQQDTSLRTFIADFERYQTDGTIDILLGVRAITLHAKARA
jgi:predicted transcriptional regulator YdeE